ncbi:MAG: HAMP domain-containing protein [Enterocloster asparagiformis]|nr:HAMP domain-containing protein [Enterocloster asparagiformis]
MKKSKFLEKIKAYGLSIRLPLAAIVIALGVVPLFIQGKVMLGSFQQAQLDARSIEIQNQCVILSNKMTRLGYMAAEGKDNGQIETQMQAIADIFNGRVVLVNRNFRVVKDTFNLAGGKFYISEEVIKCFKGENSSHHNKQMGYFAQTIPVYDPQSEKNIDGVIVVTASTENISTLTDRMEGKSNFFLMFAIVILVVLGLTLVYLVLSPFRRLQKAFDRVAQGDLESDITVDTYRETSQLSQAVKKSLTKLKAVDQSRQEFVSNVSHELKTPITSIRVLADSLMGMEDVPVELYREFMADISDEIDRENQIIEDLLTLVKMDKSAESQMNIAQVNINRQLELILKRLRPIAKRGNVELILESMREVTADVDEVKMSLAITNLVENAIKYNVDSGWVRVTLDADHKYFYIKVADSGIGIPEDALDHIFDRFFRVDKARSREVGGTGLGLAITKNVVQMHRGVIDVESVPGEGTTFAMRIPLTYIVRQEARS